MIRYRRKKKFEKERKGIKCFPQSRQVVDIRIAFAGPSPTKPNSETDEGMEGNRWVGLMLWYIWKKRVEKERKENNEKKSSHSILHLVTHPSHSSI